MMLSEAIEAVGNIVACYPNGARDAGHRYIGGLAAMLCSYPRQVAEACAHPTRGIVRTCRFLPTVADVAAWCDREIQPLYDRADRETRIRQQLEARDEVREPTVTGEAREQMEAGLQALAASLRRW